MSEMQALTAHQRAQLSVLVADLARAGNTAELSEFLDHGVAPDLQDAAGNTLLMLGAYHGQVEVAQMLLERGADPNICNARGQSPLAGALFKGERDIEMCLLSAGADPDAGTPSAREVAALFGRALNESTSRSNGNAPARAGGPILRPDDTT